MDNQKEMGNNSSLRSPSILIVDDRPENLELLVQILQKDGYTARPAISADVALISIAHSKPDLILLDIRMPEMDGFELCKRLKTDEDTGDIPIIFISALEDIAEKLKAFQVGGVDYITRPFQKAEVSARVQTHLDLAQMRKKMEELVLRRTEELQNRTEQLEKEIKARKTAGKKLKESEENYRFLVENQNDIVVKLDPENRLLFASPNYCRIFGKKLEEIINKPFLPLIHSEDRKRVEDALANIAAPPHAISHQERALTVDGWRWFEWSAKANLNDKGDMTSIISVGRDITQKIDFEERLRQYQKMEAVGRLAGGIAHEFNNMLGIIIGNTELAMDDLDKGHQAQDNLDEIKLASLRARDVVKQLLDFSHKSDLQRRPLDIYITVRDTLRLIRASMPSTIEIIEEVSAETQTVMADHNQLQQLFINLTTNAFQAMGKDGGTLTVCLSPVKLDEIEASRHPDLTPGSYILLSISDTGQGIVPKIRNKIFDPYFTTQEIGLGSGMGLAVAHGIVNNHGGIIEFDSTVGKGSTFRIYLPSIENRSTKSETDLKGPIPTGDERVLFIDDERAITKAAQTILVRLGYHVTVENDPSKALKLFYAAPDRYDLIITDMTMPKLNGDGLARKILKKRADMPIIICTGHSDRLDAQKAQDIGICHYAEKPLVRNQLANIIRDALDGQARRKEQSTH